jgi:flagellar hook-associated protein 2
VSAVEKQVQSFIKLYNSTVEAIQKQLSTKPIAKPTSAAEYATGTLFGDFELESLLGGMREAMYEPIAGLATEMSNPSNIGISTGAASGGATSQSAIEGQLTLDPTKLAEALQSNPAGVQQMLEKWSQGLQDTLNAVAEPGGTLEARANGDTAQITELTSQITTMNEMLAVREKALQATYSQLESAISKNTSQADWLTSQEASLVASKA